MVKINPVFVLILSFGGIMATFRKRSNTWQARVQRINQPAISKTFKSKSDAEVWARQIEASLDSGMVIQAGKSQRVIFSELVERYKAEVSVNKKGADIEVIRLTRLVREERFTQMPCISITGTSVHPKLIYATVIEQRELAQIVYRCTNRQCEELF